MTDALTDFVLPLDKPVGPTSHDMVSAMRRALKTRRVGHTGTLDPFASGLMLVCVNRATRLAEFLSGLDKSYEATIRLDAFTDTDDCTGTVTQNSDDWRSLTEAQVTHAAHMLTGEQSQVPPRYSAKKLAGERAYDLARRGIDVQLKPVEVTVYRIHLRRIDLPEIEADIDCSSGTYIRAIARDLGVQLGTGGHLTSLRRTRVGEFDVQRAVTVDQLEDAAAISEAAIPPLRSIAHLARIEVSEDEARRLTLGQRITHASERVDPVVVVHNEELIALARADGDVLRPTKVWARNA